MVMTRQEIARKASAVSAERARELRFDRYAKEISEYPDTLSREAGDLLANALHARGYRLEKI